MLGQLSSCLALSGKHRETRLTFLQEHEKKTTEGKKYFEAVHLDACRLSKM